MMERFALTFLLLSARSSAQQLSGNSISDFVGQLASLINQNGGLGSLVNVIQQAGNRYPSPAFNGEPGSPAVNPAYLPYPYPYEQPHRPPRPPPPTFNRPDNLHYPPPYPGIGPAGYPATTGPGFMSALASIARHDELKCVPRLLCELTSGGKPGYAGIQSSSTQAQTNKQSLISLLTVLNFIDESPLMVFGRAALLGYTARGDSKACLTAYPTCPRDPDQLVNYLNNYNGGFFRYFSGAPSPHHQDYAQNYRYAGEYSSAEYPDKKNAEERIQNRPYQLFSQVYPVDGVQHSTDSYGRPILPHSDKVIFPERTGKQLYFPVTGHVRPLTASNFFPDRTGTGNLVLDNDANRVYYAVKAPNSVVSFRDQRSIKFPISYHKMRFPSDDV